MTVKTSAAISTEAPEPQPPAGLEPFLHDACLTLYAPSFAVSRPDGQVSHGGDGFYHADRRALSRLEVDGGHGLQLAWVSGGLEQADRAAFRTVLRGTAETTPDPAVVLTRRRTTGPGQLTEHLQVTNHGRIPTLFTLRVTAGTDLATLEQVKSGTAVPARPATAESDGFAWSDATVSVRLASSHLPDVIDAGQGVLRYDVALAPGESWHTELVCTAENSEGVPFPAPAPDAVTPWAGPELRSPERALDRWLARSLGDLERLLLADPEVPGDLFLAAGAPWFATLFGRDSLWAARMLLPLGTDLAAATLRVLARRQGRAMDDYTLEQPGKILHEVRHLGAHGARTGLPPFYYGTVDATPLWVVLLHDAWRWGMPDGEIDALLPHAESALAWMRDYGDADGDGFLEYIDTTGTGLANQGWKDSGDSIRFRDGGFAKPPVALCEVQAYAYEAAVGGAALLRAFDRPGAEEWEAWADTLKSRFRERFWVSDERGPYVAVALDADKRPVDSATSNLGHLLGTGLLDQDESRLLADRLSGPDFAAGFGLRTVSADFPKYNPLGYHLGSIWPHDTAIAVHGLTRAGFHDAACTLAEGLIRAADAFGARLPELFAGYGTDDGPHPVPYPAACRPQAWAAASAMLTVQSVLGLSADAPRGTLTVARQVPDDYRPLRLTGLRLAGAPLHVSVAADGTPEVTAPDGITVRTA